MLMLFVLVAAALLVVARMLLDRRDLGLALFPARLGPAGNDRLDSPLALAIRLQRGPLIGWVVGFIAFGAIMGSIAASAADLLDSNPQLQDVLAKLGGAGALTDIFLAAIGSLGGLAVGGYAISAALRMSSEESADRLGPVLAGSVARTRWMSGHLLFVLLGPVLVLGAAGLVAGLSHGARIGDVGGGLESTLSAMLVQAPAALVMGGIAVALFGWLPRWTSLAWAALVIALLLGQLGALLQLPQALMNLSPYTHVPPVPAEPINWLSTVVLLAVAAGLMVAGLLGFRHRDVN